MDHAPSHALARKRPVWLEIRHYVEALIGSPGFAPGDRVPSERALAEQLGANRMTVRKAIDSLVATGALERNSTAGTRIPMPTVTRPVDAPTGDGIARIVRAGDGIARLVRAGGGTPGNSLLDFGIVPAHGRIAAHLALSDGSPLVVFRRLWTVNERPFCIETSHLPARRVPGLTAADLQGGRSLYALLHDRYAISTSGGERTISVASGTSEETRLLRLKPGTAILLLRLRVHDDAGEAVEYMTSVNHPELVVFRTARAE